MPSSSSYPTHTLPISQLMQKKYYNRPKFLQAPDPSVLAPPQFDNENDIIQPPLPPIMDLLHVFVDTEDLNALVHLNDQQQASGAAYHATWTSFAARSRGCSANSLIFPLPPTLEDIERMEPDMSPESVMKRVGLIRGGLCDAVRDFSTEHSLSALLLPPDYKSLSLRPPLHTMITPSDYALKLESPQASECYRGKRMKMDAETHTLSKWWTDYLLITLTNVRFRERYRPSKAVYDKLLWNIDLIVRNYQLSDSVVFLAFWYIYRLFPDGFMHPEMFSLNEGCMVAWRVFLLGNMLALKWLEDISYTTASWHRLFELPLRAVKAAERTALGLLDYNLLITNCEWKRWLEHLYIHCDAYSYTSTDAQIQWATMEAISDLFLEADNSNTQDEKPRTIYTCEEMSYQLVRQLVDSCGMENNLELTSTFPTLLRIRIRTSSTIWNPSADPIITKQPRSFGIAPIARPSLDVYHSDVSLYHTEEYYAPVMT
ncbi:hypothetical protein AMATHDRAFT_46201 [Amanita thiersii Skay4041]|uniref:Uncharacterized protein n=1 Tax=Amanita thiersii Skay4041 TaxID=703135 RepID=A0A2A9NXR7_9AGAR|nr:hypothetical protein AMATHDRAFT_46201 [Amanita thiersii Skay4041]